MSVYNVLLLQNAINFSDKSIIPSEMIDIVQNNIRPNKAVEGK